MFGSRPWLEAAEGQYNVMTLQGPISDDLTVVVNLLADGTPIMISGLRKKSVD